MQKRKRGWEIDEQNSVFRPNHHQVQCTSLQWKYIYHNYTLPSGCGLWYQGFSQPWGQSCILNAQHQSCNVQYMHPIAGKEGFNLLPIGNITVQAWRGVKPQYCLGTFIVDLYVATLCHLLIHNSPTAEAAVHWRWFLILYTSKTKPRQVNSQVL